MRCLGKKRFTFLGALKRCAWTCVPGMFTRPVIPPGGDDCILGSGFWDDQGVWHDWCIWNDQPWLLLTGFWLDAGIWIDNDVWRD